MRCYAPPSAWSARDVRLDPEEAHHLSRVLRCSAGDSVEVFDGKGRRAQASIRSLNKKEAVLDLARVTTSRPPAARITLLQCVVREQKMDVILQKAVELGAAAMVPLISEHSVVQLKGERKTDRRERWEKMILNAGKQCGAAWLPEISEATPLRTWLDHAPAEGFRLCCSLAEHAAPLARVIAEAQKENAVELLVLVGPEGDLSEAETEAVRRAGFRMANLGESVLRAETAALYVLSVLKYAFL